MLRGIGSREADVVNGRIPLFLVFDGNDMDKTVQSDTGHNVNEQTSTISHAMSCHVRRRYECSPDYLIHGVEDERVTPHGDSDSVVSIG